MEFLLLFEGKKIVAKSIELQRVSKAAFDAEGLFVSVQTYVTERVAERQGTIDLALLAKQNRLHPDLPSRVNYLEGRQPPVGTVHNFAGAELPEGTVSWMLCQGQALKSSEYPELFGVLRNIYGDGIDSESTQRIGDFNLPDYRGVFLRSVDAGRGLDKDIPDRQSHLAGGTKGDEVGSYQSWATGMPQAQRFKAQPQWSAHPSVYARLDRSGRSVCR